MAKLFISDVCRGPEYVSGGTYRDQHTHDSMFFLLLKKDF